MSFVDDGEDTARVAYAIPRRVGTAVERNRIRRRLRAVLDQRSLTPGAYLVTAERAVLHLPHRQHVVRRDELVVALARRPAARHAR